MTEQKKKVKACKDTEYLFISAYLRAKEPQLLNAEKAGRMLGSSVQEAARILESCGYADVLAVGLDKALSDRRTAVFSEVEALAPKDGVVSLFRMRYDYHNAKTIVKAEAVGIDPAPLLSGAGRADAQALKTAYETGESGSVPQAVLTAMQAARDALSRSADPQLADLILDRAYFAEYHETAAQVGSAFLMGYAQLQADSANLRAAVRARRMHKDAAFLKSVLVPGGRVPAEEICQVFAQDEPFAPLFANTALFAAAQAGDESQSGSLTAFERLCDNTLTAYFAKAKSVVFGEQVVIAYLCALENEISAARMIISGLQAGAARRHDPRTAAGSVSMSEVSGMYKIAVLGERESVMGFAALGLAVFPVDSAEEAAEVFHRLTRQSDAYAIIYVTETYAEALHAQIEKYASSVTPAVILIPGAGGCKGLGMNALNAAVERAVGSNIL